MIRSVTTAALGASALAVGFVAFAAGFATSSAFPMARAPVSPIVNPNAWSEMAEIQAGSQPSPASQERCSPWQVTDVAMEEILDEMIRRGWRAPTQGAAIASLDPAQTLGLSAIDPGAQMPSQKSFGAGVEQDPEALPMDDADAEKAPEASPAPENPPRPEPPPA